jgi:hypothetical protein
MFSRTVNVLANTFLRRCLVSLVFPKFAPTTLTHVHCAKTHSAGAVFSKFYQLSPTAISFAILLTAYMLVYLIAIGLPERVEGSRKQESKEGGGSERSITSDVAGPRAASGGGEGGVNGEAKRSALVRSNSGNMRAFKYGQSR